MLTCPKGVVSPALINAHDHLGWTYNRPADWGTERYEHRHDWRKGLRGHTAITVKGAATADQKAWGELRNVMAGTTAIAGSGGADGFLRNIDKNYSNSEGLSRVDIYYNTFPLGDSDGKMLTDSCDYGGIDKTDVLQHRCYFPHVAEGIGAEAENEFKCLSGTGTGSVDLASANSAFVHLIGMNAIDGDTLAKKGTAVIWSPRSNISLYGNTAPVTMFDRQGVLIGLGTDWTPSGSINILREFKCALDLNKNNFGNYFTAKKLWKMATINNATALRLAEVIGAIRPGMVADISIFYGNNDDPYQSVVDAGDEGVALVMRGGLPLYGDAAIMAGIPGGQEGCEEIGDVCGSLKTACVMRETGKTFAGLSSANKNSYNLFFCGTPDSEPLCVPSRTGDANPYTGVPASDDKDGDGIKDGADNCPDVFNPVRPMDSGKQADSDNDGIGDACDPCPASNQDCFPPDPDDKDGDGIPNGADNCPYNANPDQADADKDNTGDACDSCADYANPGFGSCAPVPIYSIKQGIVKPGETVTTHGVVTGIKGTNLFIQVPEEELDTVTGIQYSGIFVAASKFVEMPLAGEYIYVSGTVVNSYGQIQLGNITKIEIANVIMKTPDPVIVLPGAIKTGGADSEKYNGVLVSVENIAVTDPDLGYGEFEVAGGLRADDLLFAYPAVTINDVFQKLTGPLLFAYGDAKIEPRNAGDMLAQSCTVTGCDNAWSQCDSVSGRCAAKPGFCAEDKDCTAQKPLCNKTTNLCETDSSDMLKNGGFESWTKAAGNPDSWHGAKSTFSGKLYTASAHSGTNSCRLINATATHKRFTNLPITLAAGDYTCTYFVRGHGDIRNGFYSNNTSADYKYTAWTNVNSTSWQKVTYSFTLAVDVAEVFELVFSVANTNSDRDDIQIDDVICK